MRTSTKLALLLALLSVAPSPAGATETLQQFNLPPVPKVPWRFKQFPILAWWGPPDSATLQDFINYRDAGVNIYLANPDAGFDAAMEKATSVGLAIMPSRDKLGFNVKRGDVTLPENNPNVVGWFTGDEPNTIEQVIKHVTLANTLMRQDPSRWVLYNSLPPHAHTEFSHRDAIAAAARNGLPAVSYDNYVIMQDGTDREVEHFNNLKLYRQESLKNNIPFWAFALSIRHFDYRRPSESDLRWKQFTNLAYGAKGLWYFTWWGPTDWDRWDNKAIVNPADGSKTELYDYVKAINDNVQSVGQILLSLTSVKVMHTNPPEGQKPFVKDKYCISDITAKDAIVSLFHDPEGIQYAMIVNKLYGKGKSAAETSDTMTVHFARKVQGVDVVAWLDGAIGPLEIRKHQATMPIAGGTAVLLRIKE